MVRNIEDLLLVGFSLEELMEMNDITEEQVVVLLYEAGLIYEPENVIREFETDVGIFGDDDDA